MRAKKGFTLIELLVVISIIALLLSILMPSLNLARQQAREVVCRNKFKQWGLAMTMYLDDNEDKFWHGRQRESKTNSMGLKPYQYWVWALWDYYEDMDLAVCPSATTSYLDGGQPPFGMWEYTEEMGENNEWRKGGEWGSYGVNNWIASEPWRPNDDRNWRSTKKVRTHELRDIPVLGDCAHIDSYVYLRDAAPTVEFEPVASLSGIGRFAQNRHRGGIDMLFMDGSARRVTLKELWGLKWHALYNTTWRPAEWPDWMERLPDK